MTTEISAEQNPDDANDHSSDRVESSHKVDALIEQLSQEKQQDEKVLESHDLLFDELNADKLREREREYTDIEKHWVRSKVWLKTIKDLAQNVREIHGRGIRYFTLPGFHRLDVGLLLRENLLDIDPIDSNCVYVAGFEADPSKFGRMAGRSPKFKLLANCSVESALTDAKNDYYSELQSLFPFDVVNLDLTTSLTPQHEGPYSKTMQAINAVFKRQSEHSAKWALFLTFRNVHSDWEEIALAQLFDNLQKNIGDYPAVRDAFLERHEEHNVANLKQKRVETCISQAVVKWLIDRAHHFNIQLESYHCYQYQRYPKGVPKYTICKQVLVFSRGTVSVAEVPTKSTPRETWMEQNLVKCIQQHKPVDVEEKLLEISYNVPEIFDQIREEITQLCTIGEG
jgi:hypothetical protein